LKETGGAATPRAALRKVAQRRLPTQEPATSSELYGSAAPTASATANDAGAGRRGSAERAARTGMV